LTDFEDLDMEIDEQPVIKSKTPSQVKTPVTGSSAGPRKKVFFKSTVGPERTEKLSVGENAPVGDVKDTLSNIFGLNPDDFHLSHAGRTMDESAPIGDYGVDDGDEVLMIPHSTAGSDDFDDFDANIEERTTIKSKTPAHSKTPISGSAGSRKKVFFKSTVGPERTEKLSVGENAPVGDVKNTLSNIFGLNPDDFHLSHAGRTMDESAPIGDYGVDDGDEVLMIPHSTAG
jgi:molybdopterin converting factor small subunit